MVQCIIACSVWCVNTIDSTFIFLSALLLSGEFAKTRYSKWESFRKTFLILGMNANLGISFIFLFSVYSLCLYGTAELLTDTRQNTVLRVSVATYLAFPAVREARVCIQLSAVWTHCPDKPKSGFPKSGKTRAEYSLVANTVCLRRYFLSGLLKVIGKK